jgi:hypothetical protein
VTEEGDCDISDDSDEWCAVLCDAVARQLAGGVNSGFSWQCEDQHICLPRSVKSIWRVRGHLPTPPLQVIYSLRLKIKVFFLNLVKVKFVTVNFYYIIDKLIILVHCQH